MVFLASIDQGTTSTRFIIFEQNGNPVVSHQIQLNQHYPHPGWHEHDPLEILESVSGCIDGAISKFSALGHSPSEIAAIGISNQRETTVVWDIETGQALCKAIVWTDMRTKEVVHAFKAKVAREGNETDPVKLTGLRMSTYPSASKLVWILENVSDAKQAYEDGRLAFGTIDSWLVYNLTNRQVFATDVTNASRTMFMDLNSLDYSDELFRFFGLDRSRIHLPVIQPSSHPSAFGKIGRGPLAGVPIGGVLGDQSAALVGHLGFEIGATKNTYGTGCFLLSNVGEKPAPNVDGLISTLAYQFNGSKAVYALEGSIAVAGSAVNFLVNNLGLTGSPQEFSVLADLVPDSGGVTFVTAFSGLFAPYWKENIRGAIFGLTSGTQRGHLARACLEATALQTRAILDAVATTLSEPLPYLTVDGGLSTSDQMMQIQADLGQIRVRRTGASEATAAGAAYAAGLGVGVWKSPKELWADVVGDLPSEPKFFLPTISRQEADKKFADWEEAIARLD